MRGLDRDFTKDQLTACTLLNEPIVIDRKRDGGLVAAGNDQSQHAPDFSQESIR